ncbi:MAG TPA: helix-turn-helix domain-containing protein [Candidatus Dormibacteraeota bacterium]|nr:helix-turn-helix domain-containing protein [Candidatus Dormibacteraeota bacterium]
MTPGTLLAAKRGERGLTIQQAAAATRIRAEYLVMLESDELESFSAPVYAKGYLKAYAGYLGLEPDSLVTGAHIRSIPPRLALGMGRSERKPRVVATVPVVATAGVLLLVAAFAVYAWWQLAADQRPIPTTVASQQVAAATPSASPAIAPSVQTRPIVVGVRVTDAVWINAVVDGNSQFADSGKTLQAGSVVYFTGVDIKITSGKAAATFITIDGHSLGALGVGVATREFSSQTSPQS